MGLRFRRSVSICKGLRLNFGKTGMSLTVGTKGYHKTIHTSGKVTTTVGLPGTGIYYTETKQVGHRSKSTDRDISANSSETIDTLEENVGDVDNRKRNIGDKTGEDKLSREHTFITEEIAHREALPLNDHEIADEEEPVTWDEGLFKRLQSIPYEVSSDDDFFFDDLVTVRKPDIEWKPQQVNHKNSQLPDKVYFSEAMIREIYAVSDPPIMWEAIRMGASAVDLCMDSNTWVYCKSEVDNILNGNIDSYLDTIEYLRPVDDLLLYGGDFEFGTDNPSYIEVEFTVYPEEVLQYGRQESFFFEYLFAVSIRIARDLMSTLPVDTVIVHTMLEGEYISTGALDRDKMIHTDFESIKPTEIATLFRVINIIGDNKKVFPLEFEQLPRADSGDLSRNS